MVIPPRNPPQPAVQADAPQQAQIDGNGHYKLAGLAADGLDGAILQLSHLDEGLGTELKVMSDAILVERKAEDDDEILFL